MEEVLTEYCVNHANVETVVRCSRCDAPICPKCMISTPVGMRCRQCAKLRGSPVYELSGRYLWQAVGAAAGIVAVGGFVFALLAPFIARTLLLSFFIYMFAGMGIGELIGRAANHKRGLRLQILAIAATVLTLFGRPLLLLATTARLVVNPLSLLLVAVACLGAYNRLK
ncbi:MAG: hypothetical protein KGJ86_16470 [Chloroflexota bacterium]|nr:hypothetical protein [Chloroflexota bacterium]